MTLAFIPSDGSSLSQLSLMPVGSYLPSPSKKGMRLPDLFFRSCSNHVCAEQEQSLDGVLLEAEPQVRQSSLFAEKSHPTLTCATGRAASSSSQGRTAVVVGYRSPPQWGRMGSGSGGVVYRRFIAQCRLRGVGFTTCWVVYITTSLKNTP